MNAHKSLRAPDADPSLLAEAGRVVPSGSCASSAVMRFQVGRPEGGLPEERRPCWIRKRSLGLTTEMLLSRLGEADRVRDSFPRALDHVMPTRLGNVLRRAESQAGSQYCLNAPLAVPHLLLIAPPSHVDYVNDQRSQLDLAVRMTFVSALSCATTVPSPMRWRICATEAQSSRQATTVQRSIL
jgi:hypothetical protein